MTKKDYELIEKSILTKIAIERLADQYNQEMIDDLIELHSIIKNKIIKLRGE